MPKPLALITNDDGIDSIFFRYLIEALQNDFVVTVAAPKSEKSWIGKAVSRHSHVRVEPSTLFKCKAWSIDGTPSDCVNIALDHLLEQPPDIVISGINIGYNTSLPFILSSGTLAGAIEGSFWNIRSIAFSQQVPKEESDVIKQAKDSLPPRLDKTVSLSVKHARHFALQVLMEPGKQYCIHSINFPFPLSKNASVVKTFPESANPGGLFTKTNDDCYTFTYPSWENIELSEKSDRTCLMQGNISHSILDYSRLAVGL